MKRTVKVSVDLLAKRTITVDVEVDDDEDPTDLTHQEQDDILRRHRKFEWDVRIERVREVKP